MKKAFVYFFSGEQGRKTLPDLTYAANLVLEDKLWSVVFQFLEQPAFDEWVLVEVSGLTETFPTEKLAAYEFEILEGPERKVGIVKF